MAQTIVGLFETRAEAEQIVELLTSSGVQRSDIELVDRSSAERYERAGQRTEESGGGFWSWLFGDDSDVPDEDRSYYDEGVRRGATLVKVTARDEKLAVKAQDLMEGRGVDVKVEGRADKVEGRPERSAQRKAEGDETLSVVEEQLKVGKREVSRGGIRVYSRVTERPVEEQVRLRSEHINVERRPVDRPLAEGDERAFVEDTMELTETAEEVVVSKRTRVVEEVVISKDVDDRVETVRDTVRRTDVEVERTAGQPTSGPGPRDYAAYDAEFRSHWASGSGKGGTPYEQFTPAYRYGWEMGSDRRLGAGEWSSIEPEARRQWEERNPGTWERFKESIRYAWDMTRGRARAA